MSEKKLYNLTASQNVVKLQCNYTLFKRIVNILSSVTSDNELDFEVMKKAFNILIERNDCLRLSFVKQGKDWLQYFRDKVVFDEIPYIEFKTQKEQEKWIEKTAKKAIKFFKGKVIEPHFIKTYDGKHMIFLKVCHLILDTYGINMIYKDWFEIYDALLNNKEMPAPLNKFEDIILKDIKTVNNKDIYNKDLKFFTEILENNEEPYYAGVQNREEPIWKKLRKDNKRYMKMFFINNDTKGYAFDIDNKTAEKVLEYSKNTGISLSAIYMYLTSVTSSITNDYITNMIPLELCNCRGSALERNCAGTKVQSVGCYTKFDFEKTFEECINEFNAYNFTLFRHLNFPDMDFEMLLHKIYNSSMLSTYYHFTFSFIPYEKQENIKFDLYSNGKCALPCYVALLYDGVSNTGRMCYDVQTKIISGKDVETYHNNLLKVINIVMDNPSIKLKDIKL